MAFSPQKTSASRKRFVTKTAFFKNDISLNINLKIFQSDLLKATWLKDDYRKDYWKNYHFSMRWKKYIYIMLQIDTDIDTSSSLKKCHVCYKVLTSRCCLWSSSLLVLSMLFVLLKGFFARTVKLSLFFVTRQPELEHEHVCVYWLWEYDVIILQEIPPHSHRGTLNESTAWNLTICDQAVSWHIIAEI